MVVPHGTSMMTSLPQRPFMCAPLPCAPTPALKEWTPMVRSFTCLLARMYTPPPWPPLPPSGGPRSTRVSRKKLAQPFPPCPPDTTKRTRSKKRAAASRRRWPIDRRRRRDAQSARAGEAL
eukprot:scaffold82087_cov33-Tisochrysis_lutea.AAC.3